MKYLKIFWSDDESYPTAHEYGYTNQFKNFTWRVKEIELNGGEVLGYDIVSKKHPNVIRPNRLIAQDK